MRSPQEAQRPILPIAERAAYFPDAGQNEILANEALRRAGDNLAYCIQYGSSVAGDATATSKSDMMLIVDDTEEFHRRNIDLAPQDYATPRSAAWHTFLNKYGFNYYYTTIPTEGRAIEVKYAVISVDDFVRGCNGSLEEKETEGIGAFGLYVAGRMQKAALRPLHKGREEQVVAIEQAINTARIDGVWLALGLQEDSFTFDQLLYDYVSLSYRADMRMEKPGKTQTMIDNNRVDYEAMLEPIIKGFIEKGLMRKTDEGRFEKIQSLSQDEVEGRLNHIKWQTARINYLKNGLTVGLGRGIRYGLAKIKRSREAKQIGDSQNSVEVFPQPPVAD